MPTAQYHKTTVLLYPDQYKKFKEVLAGLPVSVWVRQKIDEYIEENKQVKSE